MKFVVDDKASFELPLESVSQTSMNKNEVQLEFHANEQADVQLVEMRFYVPPTSAGAAVDGDGEEKDAVKVCSISHRRVFACSFSFTSICVSYVDMKSSLCNWGDPILLCDPLSYSACMRLRRSLTKLLLFVL